MTASAIASGRLARSYSLEAALKCRFLQEGCYAPPVHMIKLTDTREITPCLWVHPAEERFFYLAESERKQARAKQDWTGNGHNEETERSEFITHGTPLENAGYRLGYLASLLKQNDCHLAQSKDFPFDVQFRAGLMISCNIRSRPPGRS